MSNEFRLRIDDKQNKQMPTPIRGGWKSRPTRAPMTQKVFVKSRSSVGKAPHNWGVYGRGYLTKQIEDRERIAFNNDRENVDMGAEMKSWQAAGDEKYFHLIISPENREVPVTELTKDVMAHMERDLGTKLQWAGVEHRNSDTPHTHVVIRGIDEQGKELRLGHTYMRYTLRDRAEEWATKNQGYRTTDQVIDRRERTVGREAFTETDGKLLERADHNRVVSFPEKMPATEAQRALVEQEQRRVVYLASIGLAKPIDDHSWRLAPNLQKELQFRGSNREHAPAWRKPPVQEQTPDRQRQVVRVVEMERTQGRER